MPLYDVQCEQCGHQLEIYRSIAEYNDLPECCGMPMRRMICAPMVLSDIQPYRSMIDGTMITSRSQHRTHLKDHGCIEVGNEKMEAPKRKDDGSLKKRIIEIVNAKT